MNEEEPILHISGTISEKDYRDAIRSFNVPRVLLYLIIFPLVIVLVIMGASLFTSFSDIREGSITFAEWLSYAWQSVFKASWTWSLMAVLLIYYALYLLVYRPIRAGKRIHELYPDGIPISYDFYNDYLIDKSTTDSSDDTSRIKYADVQRKITENRSNIILPIGRRNKCFLFKAIMTPEEAEKALKLLKERCPQHKLS